MLDEDVARHGKLAFLHLREQSEIGRVLDQHIDHAAVQRAPRRQHLRARIERDNGRAVAHLKDAHAAPGEIAGEGGLEERLPAVREENRRDARHSASA